MTEHFSYRGPKNIRRIAIVGAGTIGASWAAYFWARGLEVAVIDPAPDAESRVRNMIDSTRSAFEQQGLLDAGVHLPLPTIYEQLDSQSLNVDFVQENAPENLETKQALLKLIDKIAAPDVLIASSTSGLTMSELQEGTIHPDRMVIGHPMNPPHLIPLVELAAGALTAPAAIETAAAFYKSIGKVPVILKKEILGHIATRLTAALWREAANIVAMDAASAKDVDAAVVYGLGMRLSVAGPHLSYHLGGGAAGLAGFFAWAKGPLQSWCDDLGDPRVDDKLISKLVDEVQEAYGTTPILELMRQRDKRLLAVASALNEN